MVVAYLAGMPVEPDYFNNIPACTNPNQTGCICSWRTFREGHTDSFISKEKFTAVVTNPLTWDTAHTSVDRFENKGAVLQKFNKLKPNVAGATVHKRCVVDKQTAFLRQYFSKESQLPYCRLQSLLFKCKRECAAKNKCFLEEIIL
jgi:hypothetical protein